MSTERDELGGILMEEANANGLYMGIITTDNMADAILAAGYRKPRTITTVDELYALPSGSILLSHSEYPRYTGTVWRVSGLGMIEKVGREVEGVTPLRYFKDPLPVTILHEGTL